MLNENNNNSFLCCFDYSQWLLLEKIASRLICWLYNLFQFVYGNAKCSLTIVFCIICYAFDGNTCSVNKLTSIFIGHTIFTYSFPNGATNHILTNRSKCGNITNVLVSMSGFNRCINPKQ